VNSLKALGYHCFHTLVQEQFKGLW
jgi:hypothetical protein